MQRQNNRFASLERRIPVIAWDLENHFGDVYAKGAVCR